MVLVLEVISPQPSALGSGASHTFTDSGGTIGREGSNTWVLPHPKVSGRHALISYAGGAFYIEDVSRNGVFVNSSRTRMARGARQPLSSGDRLYIEPYDIRVSVETDEPRARGRVESSDEDPFGLLGDPMADDPFAPPPARSGGYDPPRPNRAPAFDQPEPVPNDELDPLALLNLQEDRPAPRKPAPNVRDLEAGSPLDQHFRPPAAVPDVRPVPAAPPPPLSDPLAIPQDYDPLAPEEPIAPPPRRAAPPPPAIVEPSAPVPDPEVPPARPRFGRPRADVTPRLPEPPPQRAPIEEPPLRQAPFEPSPFDQPPFQPSPIALAPIEPAPIAPAEPPPAAVLQSAVPPPAPPPQPAVPPQSAVASPSAVPESAAPQSAIPQSASPRPPARAAEGAADLAAVLEGAGLDPSAVTPELARAFGQIIRVVVSGVMDVLQSRREIKDEFRMGMTQFRPKGNNPLKFSVNVEDALHNLLIKRNPAFLGPVEAFDDAFAELRNHQVAMLAGMRVAFEAMLAEFDPDRLQEDFDRQANKGIGLSKMRYWDQFRDKRREMAKDPEATFRQLFGERFARAYEEQLQQLKKQEPKPKPPSQS